MPLAPRSSWAVWRHLTIGAYSNFNLPHSRLKLAPFILHQRGVDALLPSYSCSTPYGRQPEIHSVGNTRSPYWRRADIVRILQQYCSSLYACISAVYRTVYTVLALATWPRHDQFTPVPPVCTCGLHGGRHCNSPQPVRSP